MPARLFFFFMFEYYIRSAFVRRQVENEMDGLAQRYKRLRALVQWAFVGSSAEDLIELSFAVRDVIQTLVWCAVSYSIFSGLRDAIAPTFSIWLEP